MIAPPVYMLRNYLTAQGWTVERLTSDEIDLFVLKDQEFGVFEIVMPKHADVFDADRRLNQALRTLSEIEDRSVESIAAEVIGYEFDLIETSLPSNMLRRESVSLRVAETYVRRSRSLMTHAAAAELPPDSRTLIRDSRLFADGCRFGHTFHGSFGFRIMSPVRLEDVTPFNPVTMPRRIINRIEKGFIAARLTANSGNVQHILRDQGAGLNASAYDDLAEMLERAEASEVTFNFVRSPSLRDAQNNSGPIVLSTKAASLIRDAANTLRERQPPSNVEINGQVVRLFSPFVPTDLFHPKGREINVVWDSPNYGLVTVRVRLQADDYLQAIGAHEQGREVVVSGLLAPLGRSGFSIDDPTAFALGDAV